MEVLDSHIRIQRKHHWEIGKTLDPERGPESAGDAVTRLWRYFESLPADDRDGFVASLIAEIVALRLLQREREDVQIFAAPPRAQEDAT